MKSVAFASVLFLATSVPGGEAAAQAAGQDARPVPAQATRDGTTELDEVVVLARQSGAPMWTVTRGDSTLILVGSIRSIPRDRKSALSGTSVDLGGRRLGQNKS